jgi:hypothetical protein
MFCSSLPCRGRGSRIRSRLEEEDFDQVPQLATSLLIELKRLGLGMLAWIVGPKLHGFSCSLMRDFDRRLAIQ